MTKHEIELARLKAQNAALRTYVEVVRKYVVAEYDWETFRADLEMATANEENADKLLAFIRDGDELLRDRPSWQPGESVPMYALEAAFAAEERCGADWGDKQQALKRLKERIGIP